MDLTAKMSKSKKKKLKKRAKRNQQLMDETMQHIVEKEQEQVEEQQADINTPDIGKTSLPEVSATCDQQLQSVELSHSQPQQLSANADTIKKGATDDKPEQASKTDDLQNSNGSASSPLKINGTTQNGEVLCGNKNPASDGIVDDLDDLEDEECDDLLDASCKVDGTYYT